MKLNLVAAAVMFVPTVVAAQSMNAEQFNRRATSLQRKGMLAVFSGGEIKALTGEAQAASKRAVDNRRAAIAAGQAPRFCPPKGPFSMNDKELMASLSAIPTADRARIDMTEAMTRIFASKFPCR
jgi:hypothetical protein